MSKLCSRKASSMSRWVRGIYNTAANFVMSGSLRAAAGRTLDRDTEHVRQINDQSPECLKSGEPDKSGESINATNCTPATCRCISYRNTSSANASDGDAICDNQCNKCHPAFCDHIERDYNDYLNATRNTKGKDTGSRVWVSDEPRAFERTNNTTRTDVEHVTGIPTGVAI